MQSENTEPLVILGSWWTARLHSCPNSSTLCSEKLCHLFYRTHFFDLLPNRLKFECKIDGSLDLNSSNVSTNLCVPANNSQSTRSHWSSSWCKRHSISRPPSPGGGHVQEGGMLPCPVQGPGHLWLTIQPLLEPTSRWATPEK